MKRPCRKARGRTRIRRALRRASSVRASTRRSAAHSPGAPLAGNRTARSRARSRRRRGPKTGTYPIFPAALGKWGPSLFLFFYDQRVHAPAVGAQHLEFQSFDRDDLVTLGQAPEPVDHEAADRVLLVVRERGVERRVEIGDLGERLDAPAVPGLGEDVVARFVEVVLVLDLA